MSVNERIASALKRGDIAKIAEILGLAHQSVAQKLKADKEIDSVDFINAVCKVTGKSFHYFKPVQTFPEGAVVNDVNESESPYMKANHRHMPGQPDEERVENMSYENAARHWRSKYEKLEKEFRELKKLADSLAAHHDTKDELLKNYRDKNASLKKEIEQLKGNNQ